MSKQNEKTPDEIGNITLKDLRDQKVTTNKWDKIGLLEGLNGLSKEDDKFFECEQSHIINENDMSIDIQKLILAEDVFDTLKKGKKCTIRKGRRDIECYDLLFESLEDKRTELVYVTHVIYCKALYIPEEYWKNDGFTSVDDMVEQMKRFYPDMDDYTECTVIVFASKYN